MVNIHINFKKKDLWLLSAIVVFLIGVGFVIAWDSNNPAVMGHSYQELQKCLANQILKTNPNGQWECVAESGGCSLGNWETKNNNQVYQASTDGTVVAIGYTFDIYLIGYTNANADPTGSIVAKASDNGGDHAYDTITFPVKKLDYWKVVGATNVKWIPLNCN